MIRITFVMEQHVGHRAFYQNMRRFVDPMPEIASTWVPVTYRHATERWNRIPLPTNLRGTLAGRAQVIRGLHQTPYDVALFNTQVPAALGFRAVKQRPYVLCADITPIQYDQMGKHYNHATGRNRLLNEYKHKLNCRLMQRATMMLPWSTWTADSLTADYGVDERRIEVVPPGVDVDVWRPSEGSGALSQEEAKVRILFVGGDLERKGGRLLLDLFRSLPDGLAELILVTRAELPRMANVRVYADMQPNSAELIALYQSCHIFVLPTLAEAFGIAAIEAMACGLPVIAGSVGGLRDIVVDSQTGFLIAPHDGQTLSERLHVLIENIDLRQQFGLAARKRAKERFNARTNVIRTIEILQAAANLQTMPNMDNHVRTN